MSFKDPEKRRAYAREYYRKNPDLIRAAKARHKAKGGRDKWIQERVAKDPGWRRDGNLRRRFGVTLAEYNKLLLEQGGVCKICKRSESDKVKGKSRPLAVDHDHKTGVVRGLLCGACNRGLGFFRDSRDLLAAAYYYLPE